MLTFHFLNVNHGDSIILEYQGDDGTAFGVIDSNILNSSSAPTLIQKLQELGAKELSFVTLTHPHNDHYSGLAQLIETYKNRISEFYSFPLGAGTPKRLSDLAKIYEKISRSTDSTTLQKRNEEFVQILFLVKKYIGIDNWHEPNGCDNQIAPKGFKGVSISVILPLPKHKGPYFQMIERGNIDVVGNKNLNKLSMAFHIQYGGHEIILGGDGTNSSWTDHIRYCENRGHSINGNLIKLPHHGSKKDCSERNIAHLFSEEERGTQKIACISANGKSHPHPDTIKLLAKKNIKPYCTNLSNICGAKIEEMEKSPDLTAELNHLLCLVSEPGKKSVQPCQGNIAVAITKEGQIKVTPQYKNICSYRGDLDFVLS